MVIGKYQRKSSGFVGRGRVAVGGGSRSINRGEAGGEESSDKEGTDCGR